MKKNLEMKMIKKRSVALIIALSLSLALALPTYALQFNDVSSSIGTTYYDAINYVSDNGIMQGWPNGNFEPNTTISRGMFVAILYRMTDLVKYPYTPINTGYFIDVPVSSPYYDAIYWAAATGVTAGVTATTFEPSTLITRQQMMAMMYRWKSYMLKIDTNNPNAYPTERANITGYSDYASVANYARDAASWAYYFAVPYIDGSNNNMINPTGTIPRKDMAVFAINYRHNVEGIVHGRDDFCFRNIASNFRFGSQQKLIVSEEDWQTLLSANNPIVSIENLKNRDWGGVCFGLSVAAALDYCGKIDFNSDCCNNVSTIYGVPSPSAINDSRHILTTTPSFMESVTITKAQSKIFMYQLSASLSRVATWREYSQNVSGILQSLINMQAHGGVGVFCYSFPKSGGGTGYHAVVVYGTPEISENTYIYDVYDSRYSHVCKLRVSVNNNTYSAILDKSQNHNMTSTETIASCQYKKDFEVFSDLNLRNQNMISSVESVDSAMTNEEILENYSVLSFNIEGDFSIVNAEGNEIVIEAGNVNSTMDIYKWLFIPGGADYPCDFFFIVPNSASFTCTSPNGKLNSFNVITDSGTFGTSANKEQVDSLKSISVDFNDTPMVNFESVR